MAIAHKAPFQGFLISERNIWQGEHELNMLSQTQKEIYLTVFANQPSEY